MSKVNVDIKFNIVSNNRHRSQWKIYIVKVWWSEKEKFFLSFFLFFKLRTLFQSFYWVISDSTRLWHWKKGAKSLCRISANHSTARIVFKMSFFSWYYFYLIEQSKICEYHSLLFLFDSSNKKLYLMHVIEYEKVNEFNWNWIIF